MYAARAALESIWRCWQVGDMYDCAGQVRILVDTAEVSVSMVFSYRTSPHPAPYINALGVARSHAVV